MKSLTTNFLHAGLLALSLCNHAFSSTPDCTSASYDPDGDGWGWENSASCRVAQTSAIANPTTAASEDFTQLTTPANAPAAQTVLAASDKFGMMKAGNTIHVIAKTGSTWNNTFVITDTHSDFGCTGDIYDTVAVIGSCDGDLASIYRLGSSNTWQREATIDPPTNNTGNMTVAIHNNVVAIATPNANYRTNQYGSDNGTVALYRHFGDGNWEPEASLSGTGMTAGFGNGVAFSDERNLVVGRALTVSECAGTTASGCVGVNISNERAALGGVGLYNLDETGSWEHMSLPLPSTSNSTQRDNTVTYIGDAVAANHNTIVFPGFSNGSPSGVQLFVYRKQPDGTWLEDQLLNTASELTSNTYLFRISQVELSDNGEQLSLSVGQHNNTDSQSIIYTYTDSGTRSFTSAESIDSVNHEHAITGDYTIAVRRGRTALLSTMTDGSATSSPTSTSACDYSNASSFSGWGWNPVTQESCAPLSNVVNPPLDTTPATSNCIDSDGDGWGWDGVASCRVVATSTNQPATQPTTQPDAITATPSCTHANSDPDGDGWGWENNASCRVH